MPTNGQSVFLWDEYDTSGRSQCGHSIMSNAFSDNFNMCFHEVASGYSYDHKHDKDPNATPTNEPAVWTKLWANGLVPYLLSATPDNRSFALHGFNSQFVVIDK